MRIRAAILFLGAMSSGGRGFADDLDRAEPYRTEVNGAIDVLTASQAAPSQSCLSAIDEMHTTDQQLKELTGNLDEGGEAPQAMQGQQNEVAVAHDVLASDLQLAAEACRPDAERACASAHAAATARTCEAYEGDLANKRPARR